MGPWARVGADDLLVPLGAGAFGGCWWGKPESSQGMKKISTFKSANKSQQGDTRKDAQIPLLGRKHPLNFNSLNFLIVLVISFEEKYHFRSLNLSGDPDRREAVEHSECHFCSPWRGFSRAPHR